MEKIKERSMTLFVLSEFFNIGIGIIVGAIFGLIMLIYTEVFFGYSSFFENFLGGMFEYIILSLCAINVYHVYFYYKLSIDVDKVCAGDGVKCESYMVAVVLSTVTLGLYNIYWTYKLGQRLRVNAPRYGFKMLESGKDLAVLSLFSFGYISAWELIKNMNRIGKVYNQSGLPEIAGGVQ